MNKEQIDAVTYLKKQIREEIERYKIAVKIHGHEKASKTLHIQINLDEGQSILDSEVEYSEEEMSQTFYRGREKGKLPDGKEFYLRPTFNGYLRELAGLEDPHKNWEDKVQEYYKAHAPKSDTFDKVVEILSVLHGFDRYEISGSDHLKNDLGLDSLDVVELEMELEKEFNFLVDDQVWSDIQDWCVDEVVVNVEKNIKN